LTIQDSLTIRQLDGISSLTEIQWERLERFNNPFLSWRFLNDLEKYVELEQHGWTPCHTVAFMHADPVAAIPLYLKTNSHGEFVFDWMIADAYQHSGLAYFPKYVSAIPFTPVIGHRILFAADINNKSDIAGRLLQMLFNRCHEQNLSSLNFLFCSEDDQKKLFDKGFIPRHTWQYHWYNRGYGNFDDFLTHLTAKRRKQIRRERKSVQQQEIDITILEGDEIKADHWAVFYDFYCSTFERKWGEPRFTRDFFQALTDDMPESITLFLASKHKRYIAGSFTMKSADTMYGRHWGCNSWHNNLHFELCYYQTIDYCIRHRMKCLDAGVQGEHKLLRGFMPVRTTSMHWFQRPDFMQAIGNYFKQETTHVDAQISALARHCAYNSTIETANTDT